MPIKSFKKIFLEIPMTICPAQVTSAIQKKEEILKHFYAQVTICKFFEISPAIKQVLLMSALVEKSSGLYTKVSAV